MKLNKKCMSQRMRFAASIIAISFIIALNLVSRADPQILLFGDERWDAAQSQFISNDWLYQFNPASNICTTSTYVRPYKWHNYVPFPTIGDYFYIVNVSETDIGTPWLPTVYRGALSSPYAMTQVTSTTHVHVNGGCVAYNGKIYVWGGIDTGGGNTSTLEIYDPVSNTWSFGANMPVALRAMSAWVLNGKIYSIGGEGPNSGTFSSAVYRYDPALNTWAALNNFPTTIIDALDATCDGKGYVIGGRHGYGQSYGHVYQYDETNDQWISKAAMLYPTFRSGTCSYNGKIYVLGGFSKADEASHQDRTDIQVFNPASNSWQVVGQLPTYLYDDIGAVLGSSSIESLNIVSAPMTADKKIEIIFNLTPADPAPANGYDIQVLAMNTAQDCGATSALPDTSFDDITAYVTGDTTLTSGSGLLTWDVRNTSNPTIKAKYWKASVPILFRLNATPKP